jgi:hypothetical protein
LTLDLGIAPREPVFARKNLVRDRRIGFALGEFLPGDAPDQPGIAAQFIVQPLKKRTRQLAVRTPAAVERSAVHAGNHVADDMRFHEFSRDARQRCSFDAVAAPCSIQI